MSLSLSDFPVWALILLGVLALVSITLQVIALIDLYRRPTEQVVFANKWIWVAVVLLVNTIGPVIYLAAGRKPAIIDTQTSKPASPSVRSENIADALYGRNEGTGER